MMFESRVSEALCIYVGYGRYDVPTLHPDDLERALGVERARALKPELDEIIAYAVGNSANAEIDLPNIGRDAALAVTRKYWGVSRRAQRAIAWYVTHHWM